MIRAWSEHDQHMYVKGELDHHNVLQPVTFVIKIINPNGQLIVKNACSPTFSFDYGMHAAFLENISI